jgi:hypothetical protein
MHHLAMRLTPILVVITAGTAYADPPYEDAALHSSVGWGQTVVPERVSVTTEAGYDGAQQRAEATGLVEARLVSRLSVFTAVTYGEESTGASRPAIGAAFQITDPRTTVLGARISTAYKPEGFSEPEGELETIAVLSHLFARDVARAFVAYGRDPDGRESDVEAGAGFLHRVDDNWIAGVTTRYRYAIALKDPTGPKWDFIGGGVADLVLDRWRLEVLVGAGVVDTAAVSTGLLALGSVGIDL